MSSFNKEEKKPANINKDKPATTEKQPMKNPKNNNPCSSDSCGRK